MSDAPVPLDQVEHTTPDELESALLLIRKTVDEVASMKPGSEKARVVSSLYRAFQELTKELRDMREFALLDAAVEFAQEGWNDERKAETKFFEPQDEPHVFELQYGIKALYRINKIVWYRKPDGRNEVLEPFNNDHEPERIAMRAYRKVRSALRGQREWEAKQGRPHPYPKYPEYQNR